MAVSKADRTFSVVAGARGLLCAVSALALSACASLSTGGMNTQRVAPGEVPVPLGTPVRTNRTPLEASMACMGDRLTGLRERPMVIAVGEVKDYTGKYSISEGNAITQGGSLMVYSALGKIGNSISIAERFDPVIAERELGYTDRRQLGDGTAHEVNGSRVPWLPYFGGTISRSDYYIVGGITELNYNIRSGGAEVSVNNVGPRMRVFTESVAVDLRIVDSRSLIVLRTVSLTKQFSGYEVGAGVFRFFGSDLFDINIGAKGQEPLQLGIRTALEEATLMLVAAVNNVDPQPCLDQQLETYPEQSADQLRGRFPPSRRPVPARPLPVTPSAGAPAPAAVPAPPVSLNSGAVTGTQLTGRMLQVGFEFGDATLMGSAQGVLDQIVAAATANGPVNVALVARDTENWDPTKRDSLIDQRLAVVLAALGNRGIPASAVMVTWRPDRSDTSIHRDGPGLQEIAHIQIRVR